MQPQPSCRAACFRIFLIALFQLSKFAMLKLLMIAFVYKIYFNLGELGRFVVDQYEVAATAQNLAAVNVALSSGALKVPTATSIRQKGKLGWTAFLKAHPLYTDEWAANIVLMTTSHPDLLLWAQTITFKDYIWTARIGASSWRG